MRVALLIPGSGSRFYCENCSRDNGLVQGLTSRGHEVIACPMYLPIGLESQTQVGPIFYGAINTYLKQVFPPLRKAPHWLEKILDSKPVLNLAGSLSGATNAPGLGELTVSMLKGEDGNQSDELDRLVSWLKIQKPDILHLSNGLLLGVARRIKSELRIPIVCSLQDEDSWVDAMDEPYRAGAWQIMADRSSDVDIFLPVSEYYRREMSKKLGIHSDQMRVVPVGIDAHDIERHELQFSPPVLGFLAHISEAMGLRLLVESFIRLHREENHRDLRLSIAGGSTAQDKGCIRDCLHLLEANHLTSQVSLSQASSRIDRLRFLSTITVLSVPVVQGEAFGTFLLEAMATGIPVVQPALGGFPEIVESTGGGTLYAPNTTDALTEALDTMLSDPEIARKLGDSGRRSVLRDYSIETMAEHIHEAYTSCLD